MVWNTSFQMEKKESTVLSDLKKVIKRHLDTFHCFGKEIRFLVKIQEFGDTDAVDKVTVMSGVKYKVVILLLTKKDRIEKSYIVQKGCDISKIDEFLLTNYRKHTNELMYYFENMTPYTDTCNRD